MSKDNHCVFIHWDRISDIDHDKWDYKDGILREISVRDAAGEAEMTRLWNWVACGVADIDQNEREEFGCEYDVMVEPVFEFVTGLKK